VTLRNADPWDVPEINFRYFDEGTDPIYTMSEKATDDVLEAVGRARRIPRPR
jgi:hypothetical protein